MEGSGELRPKVPFGALLRPVSATVPLLSQASNSDFRAKTPGFRPPGARWMGSPRSCSQRRNVRTSRWRYREISVQLETGLYQDAFFQESRWSPESVVSSEERESEGESIDTIHIGKRRPRKSQSGFDSQYSSLHDAAICVNIGHLAGWRMMPLLMP